MTFTAIFDVDQMLYRFNGAKPEICSNDLPEILTDILTLKMEVNYRSTQRIVELQKALIAYNYSDLNGPYQQSLFKNLVARQDAPLGEDIVFSQHEDAQEEAEAVSIEVETLLNNGYNNGDIFILARTRAQLAFLEGPLTKRKIKFINLTGGSFWGSKHVQDIVSYLKLATNQEDDKAFQQVFNIASKWFVHPFGKNKGEYCHHRYLGRAFIDEMRGSFKNTVYAGWRYRSGVDDLTSFLDDLQQALTEGISSGIDFVVNNCYKQYLEKDEGLTSQDESENGKLEDFEIIKEIALQFESIEQFFAYVDEMVKQSEEAKKGNLEDFVVISTVHRVKGQERKVVFGIGISEGYNIKDETPAGLLPHTYSLTTPPQFGVLPTGSQGKVEDERCLMFVMVSRAKEKVYLSSINQYRKAVLSPSRFIKELGVEYEEDLI